jgi:hypothetical protein
VLVRTIVVLGGACSLTRPHQPRFFVWLRLCIGGNEARGGLAKNSMVKTAGAGPGEAISKTHLCMGEARWLSTELPDRELGFCDSILARGSNEG